MALIVSSVKGYKNLQLVVLTLKHMAIWIGDSLPYNGKFIGILSSIELSPYGKRGKRKPWQSSRHVGVHESWKPCSTKRIFCLSQDLWWSSVERLLILMVSRGHSWNCTLRLSEIFKYRNFYIWKCIFWVWESILALPMGVWWWEPGNTTLAIMPAPSVQFMSSALALRILILGFDGGRNHMDMEYCNKCKIFYVTGNMAKSCSIYRKE